MGEVPLRHHFSVCTHGKPFYEAVRQDNSFSRRLFLRDAKSKLKNDESTQAHSRRDGRIFVNNTELLTSLHYKTVQLIKQAGKELLINCLPAD